MSDTLLTALGLLAACCTTLSFIPQVLKAVKSGRTADISLWMYAILTTGLLLWLVYGVMLRDLPLILANGVSAALSAVVLLMKIKNG